MQSLKFEHTLFAVSMLVYGRLMSNQSVNQYQSSVVCKNALNSISAGSPPQTPLGSLQLSPRAPSWWGGARFPSQETHPRFGPRYSSFLGKTKAPKRLKYRPRYACADYVISTCSTSNNKIQWRRATLRTIHKLHCETEKTITQKCRSTVLKLWYLMILTFWHSKLVVT